MVKKIITAMILCIGTGLIIMLAGFSYYYSLTAIIHHAFSFGIFMKLAGITGACLAGMFFTIFMTIFFVTIADNY